MPGEPVIPSPKTRPVTRRTSIRQSLNLASVSKAFADVINRDKDKDNKDTNKASKTKESRRRSSAVNSSKPSAPRTSMAETRSPSQATLRTNTPDSKVVTRRRVSATMQKSSSDEQTPKSADSVNNTPTNGIITRTATLRTRNLNTTTASSLPKYRPKSAVVDQPKQPPSPVAVRAGTRRRFSSSDDEKEERRRADTAPIVSPADKGARAISPLPQRAALKPLNTTPTPPTPTKIRTGTPSSTRGSPTRPAKTFKTTTTASAVSRPPSSSSSSSIAPHTPTTPVVKPTLRRTTQDKNKSRTTPTTTSPHPESPSPATRYGRQLSKSDSPVKANMSNISEGVDEDEDENDVELLLAPVAHMAAPTPAMPRIQKVRSRKGGAPPKTPTRGSSQLPTRANMSYLSPLPPGDGDSALLRPPQQRPLGNGSRNVGRGSILSWEQLASEASKTLGEDELEKMLSDIPAPFRSGAASPALSANLEIPESPCLSALDSPSGYGSISQVLLPDVTPSPAMHASRFLLSPHDNSSVDPPVVTLLRLQLAQAENMAKERLMQMQAMEQEIHSLKEAHVRQMQETASHIAYLEANERNGEEQMAYASSLEDQLRHAEAQRERAVKEATKKGEESARRSLEMRGRKERLAAEAGCAAHLASSEWMSVKEISEVELDLVKGDRAVLSVLFAGLDQLTRALSS